MEESSKVFQKNFLKKLFKKILIIFLEKSEKTFQKHIELEYLQVSLKPPECWVKI